MNKNLLIWFALAALALSVLAACNVTEDSVSSADAMEYSDLFVNLANAKASGDVDAIAVAEEAFRNFEARILRERAGPIVAFVATVFPPAVPFVPFAMALVPLFGRRGQKHYKEAFLAAVQGRAPSAIKSVLRALGPAHSNEASKQAAEAVTV